MYECPNQVCGCYDNTEENNCCLESDLTKCLVFNSFLTTGKVAPSSLSSAGLVGPLDTGNLVNDPLYTALDKLYERGWIDKHQEVDYDPRGTTQWQDVLDLFRLQKAD